MSEDLTKETITRITADFSPEAYGVLCRLSKKFGSKAEALRRAIGLLDYASSQREEGWMLVLEKGDSRKEIVIL